ncbi:MAG: carbamoyltransferase HypF [Planctomycetes bacterium]|nr:carbamoyltransferase HypF [Planctomycetota bacterium]
MERRAIRIGGIVQGVGFRPFVHALATHRQLTGFVCNQGGTVLIEVEGATASLNGFLQELASRPPPLSQIDGLSWERISARGDVQFRIQSSTTGLPGERLLPADVAACEACLAELFDPRDRRHRYPFLNCTHCGPRLTIICGAPYDRANTTLTDFELCAKCRAEYENPLDRRFHAQPIACPDCGPQLQLMGATGGLPTRAGAVSASQHGWTSHPCHPDAADPLHAFAERLRTGNIGALKGLGGYHLACDARSEAAVGELRRRKARDEKPFAVMVRDLSAARDLCNVSEAEEALLTSRAGPIVLLRKRSNCAVADSVAPGNPWLGVMLPYTPLHHLLMPLVEGPLVMTSGNHSDEPIAIDEPDALGRLSGIADVFLVHNRPIRVRCDDSVTRIVAGAELPVRRSRGYAPQPIPLPVSCPRPILAVGGQLKATFALGIGRQAILSHHLGDLDHYQAARAFERDMALYEELFAVEPEVIAHDLHPDYASTRYALSRGSRVESREPDASVVRNVSGSGPSTLDSRPSSGPRLSTLDSRLPVQHHHAHMASCMAENGLTGPAIGVTFDGTGYGTDGAIWGGEFLVGDYGGFHRAAHFRYVGMPGGERAIQEPWRMAVAHLLDAGCDPDCLRPRPEAPSARTIRTMLQRGVNTPPTSSAGRLFDAVAALAGVRQVSRYEGQAAMELEWRAMQAEPTAAYAFAIEEQPRSREQRVVGPLRDPIRLIVDTRPLIRAVVDDLTAGVCSEQIARRFHSTIVEIIVAVCTKLRETTALDAVALSGGVFINAILTSETIARLTEAGFRVFRHRLVPPNDGGLSLGQLAIAAHAISQL